MKDHSQQDGANPYSPLLRTVLPLTVCAAIQLNVQAIWFEIGD